MPKFIVTAISSFSLQYLVEADNAEYAKDVVVCTAEKEDLHQEWMGEQIAAVHEIRDDAELQHILDHADNGHCGDSILLKQDPEETT